VCARGRRRQNGRFLMDGYASYEKCPCSNTSLCDPIARSGNEDVYAFHTAGSENWRQYDWSQISTVCVFGELDPEMLCHAHQHNVRVTMGVGAIPVNQWRNRSAVLDYAATVALKVKSSFTDGANLDIELADSAYSDALDNLTAEVVKAVKSTTPSAHVTFDVPSEGAGTAKCGTQYGRNYNFKTLATLCDFLVVMDYDSNVEGSCPTCSFANCGLQVVQQGVDCFASLGVPASKLVLAMPWYGYDYMCHRGPNDPETACTTSVSASQVGYPQMVSGLSKAIGGRRWDSKSSTPYYFYMGANSTYHRRDYDDVESLTLKYKYAKSAGARGVGMWTADGIDYRNVSQVSAFWNALKAFQNKK